MDDDALRPAIPAATLVLFRSGERGTPPEILMVERSQTMAFAAGALAFPGGRVDADDHRLAEQYCADLESYDAAARVAAIRETLEETGIAIGMHPMPEPDVLRAMRTALHARALFSELLTAQNAQLRLDALTPFARWRPNFAEARIFDARFYLGECPVNQDAEHLDDGENASLFWAAARDTLKRCDAGPDSSGAQPRIIFPTRRNLERLAQYDDVASALTDAARFDGARTITPWIEDRDGTRFLCIPDDAGYPVTAQPIGSAMRR